MSNLSEVSKDDVIDKDDSEPNDHEDLTYYQPKVSKNIVKRNS